MDEDRKKGGREEKEEEEGGGKEGREGRRVEEGREGGKAGERSYDISVRFSATQGHRGTQRAKKMSLSISSSSTYSEGTVSAWKPGL